jgi:hypothetical protein
MGISKRRRTYYVDQEIKYGVVYRNTDGKKHLLRIVLVLRSFCLDIFSLLVPSCPSLGSKYRNRRMLCCFNVPFLKKLDDEIRRHNWEGEGGLRGRILCLFARTTYNPLLDQGY